MDEQMNKIIQRQMMKIRKIQNSEIIRIYPRIKGQYVSGI